MNALSGVVCGGLVGGSFSQEVFVLINNCTGKFKIILYNMLIELNGMECVESKEEHHPSSPLDVN